MRVGRHTCSGPSGQWDEYVFEFTHRASRRRFQVRLTGDEFAQVLTSMGGIHGQFRESTFGTVEKQK